VHEVPKHERHVASRVIGSELDLAMVPARAWDDLGVDPLRTSERGPWWTATNGSTHRDQRRSDARWRRLVRPVRRPDRNLAIFAQRTQTGARADYMTIAPPRRVRHSAHESSGHAPPGAPGTPTGFCLLEQHGRSDQV